MTVLKKKQFSDRIDSVLDDEAIANSKLIQKKRVKFADLISSTEESDNAVKHPQSQTDENQTLLITPEQSQNENEDSLEKAANNTHRDSTVAIIISNSQHNV